MAARERCIHTLSIESGLQSSKACDLIQVRIPGHEFCINKGANRDHVAKRFNRQIGKLFTHQLFPTRPQIALRLASNPLHPNAVPFPLDLPVSSLAHGRVVLIKTLG